MKDFFFMIFDNRYTVRTQLGEQSHSFIAKTLLRNEGVYALISRLYNNYVYNDKDSKVNIESH